MIPITLGILLALFINNYKEDLANERFVKRSLAFIEQEMKSNRESINDAIARQEILIDSIEQSYDAESVSIIDNIQKAGGFRMPTLKAASWQSLLNSKIELIDFETASTLAEIAEENELFKIMMQKSLDYVLPRLEENDAETKKLFVIHLQNIITNEKSLLYRYANYLGETPPKTH